MTKLNRQYFKTRETHKRKFKKPWWLLWLTLLLIFVFYVYQVIQNQVHYPGVVTVLDNSQICIPTSEFKIGLASYNDNKTQIEQNLFKPNRILTDSSLNTETWIYKDLKLEWSNGHIYYMSARNSNVATPSGIKLGLNKRLVGKILFGYKSENAKIPDKLNSLQIVNCDTELYLNLEFESDTLKTLEIGIDLP